MDAATAAGLISLLIGLAGWLLSNKDAKQSKEIDLLFKKHDEDAAALAALRLEIAKEHYLKHELDARFQSLESVFRVGMNDLGAKFDRLSGILVEHITSEDKKR